LISRNHEDEEEELRAPDGVAEEVREPLLLNPVPLQGSRRQGEVMSLSRRKGAGDWSRTGMGTSPITAGRAEEWGRS
jgi:hypothetical protein